MNLFRSFAVYGFVTSFENRVSPTFAERFTTTFSTFSFYKVMNFSFKKGKQKNLLSYMLHGQLQTIDLGPLLPFHDLAHYLIETHFQFEKGFFGYLKAGKSIEELSTTTGIGALDREIWLVEILTRNLQALHSGSLTPEQYIPLVIWELEQHPDLSCPNINLAQVQHLKQEYQALCTRWEALEEGETLVLSF